jgi:hypothetical protein
MPERPNTFELEAISPQLHRVPGNAYLRGHITYGLEVGQQQYDATALQDTVRSVTRSDPTMETLVIGS